MVLKMKLKIYIKKIKKKSLKINFDNEKEINKLFYLGSFPDPDIINKNWWI